MDLMRGGSDAYEDHQVQSGGYQMFDPMEGNLAYAVWKYERMDWHSFEGQSGGMYEYGEYKHYQS